MAKSHPSVTVQPSLFDIFYEEFLTQFMAASSDPAEISTDFMKLKTDLERAEFLTRLPFIRDFEIKNKAGLKCIEKAVKYREEGNKLFQVLEKFFRNISILTLLFRVTSVRRPSSSTTREAIKIEKYKMNGNFHSVP